MTWRSRGRSRRTECDRNVCPMNCLHIPFPWAAAFSKGKTKHHHTSNGQKDWPAECRAYESCQPSHLSPKMANGGWNGMQLRKCLTIMKRPHAIGSFERMPNRNEGTTHVLIKFIHRPHGIKRRTTIKLWSSTATPLNIVKWLLGNRSRTVPQRINFV